MLSKENIVSLLTSLQFSKDLLGKVWRREFQIGCTLEVDVAGERFLYEKAGITVTGATTANFSQKENFVVFECVCRLLEKGYRPKDIELEPTWKLGHTDKGGRADIWIRTKTRNKATDSLLIIECKTSGREFDGAWRDTLEDGAQLFSYYQQEASTKYLCLYTSDLSPEGKPACDYRLIRVEDNPDYLKTLKKPRTFAAATTAKDRFAVWRDTYRLDAASKGLFEPEIAPYKPGKTKYSTADLVEIDHASMQKKYNEFATILRQYNVSGHENAFDKLVNLFLAKVVDETENPQDLKFYWKGIAYDDAFSLQDRLQYLYMVGMKKFLGETVTYIDEAQVKKAFRRFENDPDATKDAILDYFRKLKFYTNNDFSFIDVHNERLFKENFAVLLAIVRMLEDIKLKTGEPNQFLGDLFEGFLDNGIKQSEGQFFTPLPIVRFIVSSLPLQDMVRSSAEPPHVIDYACGAGHFLNEYAQQAKPFIRAYFPDHEKTYYSAITGIEKEYRLSKVAKVAAFMYGEDDIKIIYADALAKNPDVPEETFDILVANPPYSVDGFLQTLSEEDRGRYELMGCKPDPAKLDAIQTFFVERAVQLLKPTGIAAVILPSSILSNGGNVYVKCREIILENFDIVAIAEFGSGTFGATGTNTATFFLRKKDSPPDFATHWKNRADAWFAAKHGGDEVFGDSSALERYCAHRKFDLSGYKDFLAGKPNALGLDRDAEREKLAFFLMADANPVPVLVIKMPAETKASKAFLGYEWSKRKGNEGIKYLGAGNAENELDRNKGIAAIKTPLFDNARLNDACSVKLNSLVRQNFRGALDTIPDELKPYTKQISLVDMLDFETSVFEKQFRTSPVAEIQVASIYPLVKLGAIAPFATERVPYGSIAKDSYISTDNMLQDCGGVKPYEGEPNISAVVRYRKGDILVSNIRPYLKKLWLADRDGGCSPDVLVFRIANRNEMLPPFLRYILSQEMFFSFMMSGKTGVKMPRGNKDIIPNYQIPVPPLPVQKKVVQECEKVDQEYNTSRMEIEEYRSRIAKIFEQSDVLSQIRGG
ncbi:MAG: N-6 DNA methylase [Kiritimatiellae bacterium]|nr:N-6 DNA methylase [Kiritimatiellia bacterium]